MKINNFSLSNFYTITVKPHIPHILESSLQLAVRRFRAQPVLAVYKSVVSIWKPITRRLCRVPLSVTERVELSRSPWLAEGFVNLRETKDQETARTRKPLSVTWCPYRRSGLAWEAVLPQNPLRLVWSDASADSIHADSHLLNAFNGALCVSHQADVDWDQPPG